MNINFDKTGGLVPAIVQHVRTGEVLMLGYMNEEAYAKTVASDKVTFYSRSKKRLWTKGESSGNFLNVQEIRVDCDNDTLLIQVTPEGPVCHKGTSNCFDRTTSRGFVSSLDQDIQRYKTEPREGSYTTSLYQKGIDRIAQKVGEEAVELVIASKNDEKSRTISEAADLVYHMLVLLAEKGLSWVDLEEELFNRKKD